MPNAATTIQRVQIFKTGTHNGDSYTTDDLDDMVENFGRAGFRVPVKLGHTKAVDAPAIGWVEKVWREGDTLWGDFVDVDPQIVAKISQRRYGPISAEIFWNLEREGKKLRRVLGGIALLGADVPAVNLRPVWEALPAATWEMARVYTFAVVQLEDPSQEVLARMLNLGEDRPSRVLAADPELLERYAWRQGRPKR